jgi:hypothetical protein
MIMNGLIQGRFIAPPINSCLLGAPLLFHDEDRTLGSFTCLVASYFNDYIIIYQNIPKRLQTNVRWPRQENIYIIDITSFMTACSTEITIYILDHIRVSCTLEESRVLPRVPSWPSTGPVLVQGGGTRTRTFTVGASVSLAAESESFRAKGHASSQVVASMKLGLNILRITWDHLGYTLVVLQCWDIFVCSNQPLGYFVFANLSGLSVQLFDCFKTVWCAQPVCQDRFPNTSSAACTSAASRSE